MSSRKEEERNEKIIRGLMKLPPNRRCINCNSLGPQYVCTNFWTFICMTCSGIHREFTHRVKSVSMAKFSSQEVEALQNGGNQRAREIYLKYWDLQVQRLPNSSNVEKVRDFIKNVYVDGRYAGGKGSDKPPRDTQSPRIHEDETRRASSYHSYSQSPPYDYQYEDRRYGKQSAILSRKFGSDGGRHEGKLSSFICSPGRFSDQSFEDRFANDGTSHRVSDYSACSGGDPFKYDVPSPNFHKENGFNSPVNQPFGGNTGEDVLYQASTPSAELNATRVGDGIPRPQVPASSLAPPIGSFQPPWLTTGSSESAFDLFDNMSQQHSTATASKIVEHSFPKNEGWATFDTPQPTASTNRVDVDPRLLNDVSLSEKFDPLPAISSDMQLSSFDISNLTSTFKQNSLNNSVLPTSDESSLERFDPLSSLHANFEFLSFENYGISGPGQMNLNPRNDISPNVPAPAAEPWNAFENTDEHPATEVSDRSVPMDNLSSSEDYLGSTYFEGETCKSHNPFDSDSEHSNMFLDMSSLKGALPNSQLQSTFNGDVAEPCFSQNPVAVPPYISSAGPGALTCMTAHPPSSQIPNVHSQGPVASIGGNPFA